MDALLEATTQILRLEGYGKLNTNRIAKRAGVSVGSLYQYFRDKDALCAVLTDRHVEAERKALFGRFADLKSRPLAEVLRETVRTAVDLVRSDATCFANLYRYRSEIGAREKIERSREEMEKILREYYRTLLGRRHMRNPDIAAFFAVNTFWTLIYETLEKHPQWLGEERFVDELTSLLLGYFAFVSSSAAAGDGGGTRKTARGGEDAR